MDRSPHKGGSLSDGETSPLLKRIVAGKSNGKTTRRRHSIQFGDLLEQPWTWKPEDAVGTMGAPAFVVNMFADLCPPGLLPLASGLRGTGYVAALLILLSLCSACVYAMWCVGRTAEITGGHTFRAQWENTLGKRFAWIPVAVVVCVCFGCNFAYSCFFADIFASAMPALGATSVSRSLCLAMFSFFPVLPLCMLKDLSAFAYTSFAALLVVLYTAGMMCYRAVDGSYAAHGAFARTPAPEIPHDRFWGFGMESLVLVNFLAMAYLSHYNGCKYYRELKGHSPARLRSCTMLGMGITSLFYIITAVAAFETFGRSARGVILENYANEDMLANVARLGMGFSIIASFPLMFSGLREAVIELLVMVWPASEEMLSRVTCQNALSAFLLLLVTLCAWIFVDAKLVVGLVGAICGSATIYIMPCALYAMALRTQLDKENHMMEIAIASSVATLGAVLSVVGTISSLMF